MYQHGTTSSTVTVAIVLRGALILLLAAGGIWSVEVPAVVQSVYDGDTMTVTVDGAEERVRLLWVDTPEVKGNAHGEAMPEGKQARDFVRGLVPPGTPVVLWGPEGGLKRDHYKRILAVVVKPRPGMVAVSPAPDHEATEGENLNLSIVVAGFSPYWRKYGKAPGAMNTAFASAQATAEKESVGAWATAPSFMRDKANETTAPKKR
jgi:endonuclease YncB( thermonuclease family)